MRVEGEAVLAKCAFGRGNRHTAYLTPDALLVKIRNQPLQRFERSAIKKLQIRHRILWLPLVLGGILTPFAVVALIKTTGAFWLLFILALAGLVLFYYGYSGSDSFTITTPVKDYDYFIDRNKPHLKAFIQFVEGQLMQSEPHMFIGVSHHLYQKWISSGMVSAGTEIYFQRYDMPRSDIILRINPQEQDMPLDFQSIDELARARTLLKEDMPLEVFEIVPG